MRWIFFALLTHLFWGITNVGEKYLVDKQFKNPFVYSFVAFIAGAVGLVVLPFIDLFVPDAIVLFWIFIASIGFFVGCIFYIKAVQLEEVSRINLLWSFLPIFSLFGAWIFIGERLTVTQLSAFVFLVCGGFIASLHAKQSGKFHFSIAFVLMFVGCIFIAVYNVILRYLTDMSDIPFSIVFVYSTIFFILLSTLFFVPKRFRDDFKIERKQLFKPKVLGFVLGVNILSKVGLLFSMWAVSLAPVSLVNSMEGTQAIIVFFITLFLTLSFPHIIKEEIDKKNIVLKVVAICFVVVGLMILAFA